MYFEFKYYNLNLRHIKCSVCIAVSTTDFRSVNGGPTPPPSTVS